MASEKKILKLGSETRAITGRKVKQIREAGFVPANVYGKKIKSTAIKLTTDDFSKIYKEAGETGLIQLKIKGEEKERPVLIHHVQRDPVLGNILHVDFYQVDLKEKVTAQVPVELVGEAPAAKERIGILIQPMDSVEVEALPTDLPEKLEIDITSLKAVDDVVTVANFKIPKGVTVLTPDTAVIAKIDKLAEEVVAPAPAPEAVPVEGEAAVPVEGETAPAAEGEGEKASEKKAE